MLGFAECCLSSRGSRWSRGAGFPHCKPAILETPIGKRLGRIQLSGTQGLGVHSEVVLGSLEGCGFSAFLFPGLQPASEEIFATLPPAWSGSHLVDHRSQQKQGEEAAAATWGEGASLPATRQLTCQGASLACVPRECPFKAICRLLSCIINLISVIATIYVMSINTGGIP